MATSGSWNIEWPSNEWGGYPKKYVWTGNWSKSGNTVTLSSMTLQIVMISGTGWGTASDSVTVTGGSAQTVSFTMNGASSNVVSLNNASNTVSSTQTSLTIQCAIAGEVTGSTFISFDPTYTKPSTPTITNVSISSSTKFDVTVNLSSFGTPSTGTLTLYCGTSSTPTTSVGTSTSTGDTTFHVTGLTPDTVYYLRARANNGQLDSDYSTTTSGRTLPASTSPTLYGPVSDGAGGYETKKVEKLYGPLATQVNVYSGTIRSGSELVIDRFDSSIFNSNPNVRAVSGNISYIKSKYDPSEGERLIATLTDSTTVELMDYGDGQNLTEYGIFYRNDPLSDIGYIDLTSTVQTVYQTKKIIKLYGSESIQKYIVTALSNNTNFDTTTFMSKWESLKGFMEYPPKDLQVVRTSSGTNNVRVRLDKGGGSFISHTIFTYTDGAYDDEGSVWGFAQEPVSGTFTSEQSTAYKTKLIFDDASNN